MFDLPQSARKSHVVNIANIDPIVGYYDLKAIIESTANPNLRGVISGFVAHNEVPLAFPNLVTVRCVLWEETNDHVQDHIFIDGLFYPIRIKRIYAAGTTATNVMIYGL